MAAVVVLLLSLIYLFVNASAFVLTLPLRFQGESKLAIRTVDSCVTKTTPVFVILFLVISIYGLCF